MGRGTVEWNWCHFTYSHFAYSHFAYLLPHSAISPTHTKCEQNTVKQLKQAVQVYKIKGIVQEVEDSMTEQKFL